MNPHDRSSNGSTDAADGSPPTRPGKVITVFNHKGGVGKTTTCVGLAWKLAEEDPNNKVLIIDGDPQCNTTGFLVDAGRDFLESSSDRELQQALRDVDWAQEKEPLQRFYEEYPRCNLLASFAPLVYDEDRCSHFGVRPGVNLPTEVFRVRDRNSLLPEAAGATIAKVARKPPPTNLYVLGSHLELSDLEQRMFAQTVHTAPYSQYIPGCFSALFHLLMREHGFNYILCDVSPSASFLNRLIITSSDYLLMPCSLDYYSSMAMSSLSQHLPEWDHEVRAKLRPHDPLPQAHRHFALPQRRPLFIGHTHQLYTLSSDKSSGPAAAFRRWGDRIDDTVRTKLIPELSNHAMALPLECFGSRLYRGRLCNAQSLAPIAGQLHIPLYAVRRAQVKKVRGHKLGENDKKKIRKIQGFFNHLVKLVKDPFDGRDDLASKIYQQQDAAAFMLQHNFPFKNLDEAIRRASNVRDQMQPRQTTATPPTPTADTAPVTAGRATSWQQHDEHDWQRSHGAVSLAPSQQMANGRPSSASSPSRARSARTKRSSAKTRGKTRRTATAKTATSRTKTTTTTTTATSGSGNSTTTPSDSNKNKSKIGTRTRQAGASKGAATPTSGSRSSRSSRSSCARGPTLASRTPSSQALPTPPAPPPSASPGAPSPVRTRSGSTRDKGRRVTRRGRDGGGESTAARRDAWTSVAGSRGHNDNAVVDTLASPPALLTSRRPHVPSPSSSSLSPSSAASSSQRSPSSTRGGGRQQRRARTGSPRMRSRLEVGQDDLEPPAISSTPTDSKRKHTSAATARNLFVDGHSSSNNSNNNHGAGQRGATETAARDPLRARRYRRTARAAHAPPSTLAADAEEGFGEPPRFRAKRSLGL